MGLAGELSRKYTDSHDVDGGTEARSSSGERKTGFSKDHLDLQVGVAKIGLDSPTATRAQCNKPSDSFSVVKWKSKELVYQPLGETEAFKMSIGIPGHDSFWIAIPVQPPYHAIMRG